MKQKLIVLALTLIPTILISQKLVTLENTWTYFLFADGYNPAGNSNSYTEIFKLDSQEVLLDNKIYYEVIIPTNGFNLDSCNVVFYDSTNHFVREDSLGRVYMRDSFSNENLVYDFTLEVNDTFYNEVTNEEIILIEKDSIELTDGSKREWFLFANDEIWIKGFGSSKKLFNIIDTEMDLLCFKKNCESLYISPFQNQCFIALVNTKELITDEIEIIVYPNPTKSNIKIELSDDNNQELELFSIDGKLVKAEYTKTKSIITIELSNLRDGIYFLKIGEAVKKIVKVK